VHSAILDCRHAIKPGPIGELLRAELLATPGADNNIRFMSDNFLSRHDAILSGFSRRPISKDINAASGIDQL
jgi:hypothetical protein